ncbi:isochorismatase family protein [Phyllobacterium leguminum]|uniref:Nicotinamidase-related amidase n=1 Tax=Phyllobacterium leguminum TaxID=314237 RepID=A0A318TL20_9HYPH|nr:isochorismatase family protein [Phyllobacterium leguminum]PYE90157.1 nicotinamidase-related amidase [Phyllobacterium leguminum]
MKALLIIDMQMEMQRRIEGGRDHVNPDAPAKIAELSDAFRQKGLPVIHIRHRDEDPASPFHFDAAGYSPMRCAEALDDEPVFFKRTSSGFASTDLAAHLHDKGIVDLVVTGAVAGFCVNSTVRAGADLGFNMMAVRDAVIGFDLPSAGLSARTIFDVTMAHLEAGFAKVVNASPVLAG